MNQPETLAEKRAGDASCHALGFRHRAPWGSTVPVEATLGAFLDKDWENRSLAEIFKAPVSALQGVSEGDADLLNQAFNIKQ